MTKEKVITVLGPDNAYLSRCTLKKAIYLLESKKAIKIDSSTVKLKNTKKEKTERKREIIADSNRTCYICNEQISPDEIATIDHVIPKSRHIRADTYDNMKCCCVRCNNDKSNMTQSEYVSHIYDNREQYEYISDKRLVYLKSFAELYEEEFYSEIHILKRKTFCKKSRKKKGRKRK